MLGFFLFVFGKSFSKLCWGSHTVVPALNPWLPVLICSLLISVSCTQDRSSFPEPPHLPCMLHPPLPGVLHPLNSPSGCLVPCLRIILQLGQINKLVSWFCLPTSYCVSPSWMSLPVFWGYSCCVVALCELQLSAFLQRSAAAAGGTGQAKYCWRPWDSTSQLPYQSGVS